MNLVRAKGEDQVAIPSDGNCRGCGRTLYGGYVFTLELSGEKFCEQTCASIFISRERFHFSH